MFTVRWSDAANTRTLALLLRANDKPGLWAIVRDIDLSLRLAPADLGESRDEGRRFWGRRPFGVWFRIDEDTRVVHILDIRFVGY